MRTNLTRTRSRAGAALLSAGLCGALLVAPVGAAGMADGLSAGVDRYRAQHEAAIVGRHDDLARFKSVAADPAGIAAARTVRSIPNGGSSAAR